MHKTTSSASLVLKFVLQFNNSYLNQFSSISGGNCIIKMGRINIATEVSLLASHVALPREGHLEAVFNMYAYLKHKHNSCLALDPTYARVHIGDFREVDWTDFDGEVREAIPDNAPEPQGKEVILWLFVESDHANDKLRRRSRMGFCIFINMGCVIWFTK